jgi:citrate lyase subunit beta/citryl-CoA lyase
VTHPREVLLGAQAASQALPVADHYCGVEARITKSLKLQEDMAHEFGACVFDVSLDCEDGAPAGGESEHAKMVAALLQRPRPAIHSGASSVVLRTAVRVHPVDHPAFADDVATVVGLSGPQLCHVMIPKAESVADIELAVRHIDAACEQAGHMRNGKPLRLPVQALIESSNAVHRAYEIASHPRLESLSFGMMDFVSSHGGAIPMSALDVVSGPNALGQFEHPLIVRAKLEISAACHAHGKVPSHSVITEFNDAAAMQTAARRASREFGFTRMWSIHPNQIRPILAALAPDEAEIAEAAALVAAAQGADWAPISFGGRLHDRASYRYFWQVLERAHATGQAMPAQAKAFFAD